MAKIYVLIEATQKCTIFGKDEEDFGTVTNYISAYGTVEGAMAEAISMAKTEKQCYLGEGSTLISETANANIPGYKYAYEIVFSENDYDAGRDIARVFLLVKELPFI